MSQYPKMMYKAGKGIETNIGEVANIIVKSDDEESAAIKDGWFLTPKEALTIENNIESLATEAIKGMTREDIKEKFTVKELKSICKEVKIGGYSRMKEDELVDNLYEVVNG
jgi:hypothetical protein